MPPKKKQQPSILMTGKKKSHAQLNSVFRKLGAKLRTAKAKQTLKLLPLAEHNTAKLESLLNKVAKKQVSGKAFDSAYRGVWARQDEFFSTASTRELAVGAFGTGTTSATLMKNLVHPFGLISRARASTHVVGFATKKKVMQHPTKAGTGLYAESGTTMSMHYQLDLARRNEVAEAMETAVKTPGVSAEEISKAGVRRSIEFTLNKMYAPPTASNIKVRPMITQKAINKVLLNREWLKLDAVRLGSKQDSGKQKATDPWNRSGKRSISPPRLSPSQLGGGSVLKVKKI